MEQLNELQKIQEFYKQALESLNNNDYKSATKILYNDMPIGLYESSIDILFNRNGDSDDIEFNKIKQLIKMVDNKLVNFSSKDDEIPDVKDQFIGDIF